MMGETIRILNFPNFPPSERKRTLKIMGMSGFIFDLWNQHDLDTLDQ